MAISARILQQSPSNSARKGSASLEAARSTESDSLSGVRRSTGTAFVPKTSVLTVALFFGRDHTPYAYPNSRTKDVLFLLLYVCVCVCREHAARGQVESERSKVMVLQPPQSPRPSSLPTARPAHALLVKSVCSDARGARGKKC